MAGINILDWISGLSAATVLADADHLPLRKAGDTAEKLPGSLVAKSGANADITSMTGLSDDGIPLAKVATAAASGANSDITSMTGLSDDGVPLAKVANAASDGANSDITSMTGITGEVSTPTNLASKTTATLSKTIGAGGDYSTFVAAVAAMPNLIAHAVTLTIEDGTTLTEVCSIANKHGITSAGSITVQAEKYFPTTGVIPTVDSATATTLADAALATAAKGDDYFNGCWVLIVDGTGTDNGYVAITDYTDVSGTVTVASWPGTEPDNTSRYIIVGALVDGGSSRAYGFNLNYNSVAVLLKGIGIKAVTAAGVYAQRNTSIWNYYMGAYGLIYTGFYYKTNGCVDMYGCGSVGNNTGDSANHAGIVLSAIQNANIERCGLSDNLRIGCLGLHGTFGKLNNNFGDLNGTWGSYAQHSGQLYCPGTECSGTSGDHSNGSGDGSLAY